MKITGLRTSHFENPIGYAVSPLSFSWKVEEAKGKNTALAQVKIAADKDMQNILWDSTLREDIDSACLMPDFVPAERTRYYWQVLVKDDAGEQAISETAYFETPPASLKGKWITAPFDKNIHGIYKKTWEIKAESRKVKSARLYITGLGVYEAYVNGKKAGEEYLAPFYNDYNNWIQFQSYDVTDLLTTGTNELGVMLGNGWYKGRFGFVPDLDRVYGDTQALLCELAITWEDGQQTSIVSDESFLCHTSPILSSSIYDGEEYDANRAIAAFCQLTTVQKQNACGNEQKEDLTETAKQGQKKQENTESAEAEDKKQERAEEWVQAVLAALSIQDLSGRLSPRYSLPLTAHEEIKPVQVIHTPAGETVLDFGQELTGSFRFCCYEPKGARVKLQFGEILQNDVFYNENLRTAKEAYTYISDGVSRMVRPYFTFYGYRYMKVEGISDIAQADFRAVVLHSDLERTGMITTSDERVNRLFLNALWGQKGNFVDVPTDCPQRDERMGWTGDAQVFAATASFNMYTPAFYAKFLYDMLLEQRELDGAVPHVVPDILDQINVVLADPIRAKELGIATKQEENGSGIAHGEKEDNKSEETEEKGRTDTEQKADEEQEEDKEQEPDKEQENVESPEKAAGSCAWGDAATVIPWTTYVFYGDKSLLEKEYPNMKLWTDYIYRIDEEKCGGRRLWQYGFHFADWLALDNFHKDSCFGGTDPYFIASAYYLYSAELTAKAAAVLGKKTDAAFYEKLAEEVRLAMQKEYFTETGRIAIDTQTAMVVALKFGIVPSAAKERLIEALKKKLEEENIHLTTGFVGTPYLCPVLTENGLASYAYTLLLNEDFPSWLYEVKMGATTIWERWNSVLPDGSISGTGMNSLNHYAYGSIVEWMYRYMCGINPDEEKAGFKHFTIQPYPDERLGHAKASYNSTYGMIESSWEKTADGWKFEMTVPFDTKATFVLPEMLWNNGKELAKVQAEAEDMQELSRIQTELESAHRAELLPGHYQIALKNGAYNK